MELVNCPECNKKIPKDSMFCKFCGAKINQYNIDDSKIKKLKEPKINKKKNLFILTVLVICVISIMIWQVNTISTAKHLYNQGEYEKAEKQMNKIMFRNSLKDYASKIEVMGKIDRYMNSAEKYIDSSDVLKEVAIDYYLEAVGKCIGYNDRAKDVGCYDELLAERNKAAQILVNNGVSIAYEIGEKIKEDKYFCYPLSEENPSNLSKTIYSVSKGTSKIEATMSQNHQNPIQIIDKSLELDDDYYHLNGTISNVDTLTHSYVEVRVTYYDNNDEVLTTDTGYAVGSEGIRAGENKQFEIMTKVNGSVDKYKVEIQDYN